MLALAPGHQISLDNSRCPRSFTTVHINLARLNEAQRAQLFDLQSMFHAAIKRANTSRAKYKKIPCGPGKQEAWEQHLAMHNEACCTIPQALQDWWDVNNIARLNRLPLAEQWAVYGYTLSKYEGLQI